MSGKLPALSTLIGYHVVDQTQASCALTRTLLLTHLWPQCSLAGSSQVVSSQISVPRSARDTFPTTLYCFDSTVREKR
eukprot:1158049-Pelagomonas_calceolata.AAC.4